MPRLINRNPTYRHHKASGQAIVTLGGQDIYLGPHGTTASKREYDRLIGEYLSRGRQTGTTPDTCRVADVIKSFWDFARGYHGDAQYLTELRSYRLALGFLRRLYGDTLAKDFGPLVLQTIRGAMVKEGASRGYLNSQIGRIKRCFKWAAAQELVPPSTFHGLQAVAGLRKGKTDARETEPVKPVPDAWIEATIPHVSPQVAGLIQLQWASGMRPGEAVILRGCDIETSGKVWQYKPQRHKTEHHGHERAIFLGPQAQEVIRPFLKTDLNAYLFSPVDAEQDRREKQHESRKTPLSCGNRPGSNRKRKPRSGPTDRYTVDSYRRAIARACDPAFPPPPELARQKVKGTRWETAAEWQKRLGKEKWAALLAWREDHRWHPHQLRHSAATRLRKRYGLEAARVVLGHRSAAVAEVYAEIDQTKAEQIMGEVG
jgi:integrase